LGAKQEAFLDTIQILLSSVKKAERRGKDLCCLEIVFILT